jgi:prolyl-tRNA synthetase
VAVVPANSNEKEQADAAEKIYQELTAAGLEVLLDDREERMGVKLKDMDLIGIPLKIIIGKALKEGKVEIKTRKSGETRLVEKDRVLAGLEQ